MNTDIVVDQSTIQKALRVEKLRAELKPLGYSVVDSRYLAGLLVLAKRLQPMETAS